jgi:hypothetical protein
MSMALVTVRDAKGERTEKMEEPLRELIVFDRDLTIINPVVDHWHHWQQFDVAHFVSRAECDAAPSRRAIGAFCDQPFPVRP